MTVYLARTYSEALQRHELEDPDIVTLVVEEAGRLIAFVQMRRGPARTALQTRWRWRSPGSMSIAHGTGVASRKLS